MILLENLIRRAGSRDVTDEDVRALAGGPAPAARHRVHARPRADAGLHRRAGGRRPRGDARAAQRAGGDPGDRAVDPGRPGHRPFGAGRPFRTPEAYERNIEREYRRNGERYSLLRWAQQAFDGLRVVPPGAGHLPPGEPRAPRAGRRRARRRGVPRHPRRHRLAHDDDQRARRAGLGRRRHRGRGRDARPADVPAAADRDRRAHDRARCRRERPPPTSCSRSPRCSASTASSGSSWSSSATGCRRSRSPTARRCRTCARSTGRPRVLPGRRPDAAVPRVHRRGDRVDLVERYTKEQGMFRRDGDPEPMFSEILELDLSAVVPSMAGPKRPQDRVALPDVWDSFVGAFRDHAEPDPKATEVGRFVAEGGTPRAGRAPRRRRRHRSPGGRGADRARQRGDRRDHELHEHLEPERDAGGWAARAARRSRPGSTRSRG